MISVQTHILRLQFGRVYISCNLTLLISQVPEIVCVKDCVEEFGGYIVVMSTIELQMFDVSMFWPVSFSRYDIMHTTVRAHRPTLHIRGVLFLCHSRGS